ncbi:MAG: Oligopeptide transport system permease protein OppB [uncultured Thermomicrobiales bacterium]|uniref:Oligopeptide transport system permease protein OppB n=1 Tax=uncultured Thermomicrobiales bacterium TaxID=1645740 RepID=A0A6J4UBX3_9BACT|nr:MAG: Oligopeptide transport system permease protein OppB [uncultured Thermomicrobiales bacterium]
MIAVLRPLAVRALTLFGVLIAVLVLLVLSLGATGFSDDLLNAQVSEQLRGEREGLARTIRDPAQLEAAVAERQRQLEAFYGLDDPWYIRLPPQVFRVLRLDLGEARSLRTAEGSTRIADIVQERLPYTVLLLTTSTIITALVGLAVGARMATRVGSRIDRAMAYFAAVSFAVPSWWLGILLILVLAFQLDWLPSGGMYSTPPPTGRWDRAVDLAHHAILPILTLVPISIGPYIYTVRTMTVTVAQEDHVQLARAKGLPEGLVNRRHILRVAAPPIVTGLILGLAGSLSGSILVETVFNWQGMGRLYYDAVSGTPDEGVIVALTFVFTLMYVVARFVLDILYVLLDPRVRYG